MSQATTRSHVSSRMDWVLKTRDETLTGCPAEAEQVGGDRKWSQEPGIRENSKHEKWQGISWGGSTRCD
jgi:hypothetical protein